MFKTKEEAIEWVHGNTQVMIKCVSKRAKTTYKSTFTDDRSKNEVCTELGTRLFKLQNHETILLALQVIETLKKANKGCKTKSWKGFENGKGQEVGTEIDELIRTAKEILKKYDENAKQCTSTKT